MSTDAEWTLAETKPVVLLKGEPNQQKVLEQSFDSRAIVGWTKCGVMTEDAFISTVLNT